VTVAHIVRICPQQRAAASIRRSSRGSASITAG
jgi:hypothetical protein